MVRLIRRSRGASGRRFRRFDLRDMAHEWYLRPVHAIPGLSHAGYVDPMTNVADLEPPQSPNGKEVLIPSSRAAWRNWLDENADRREGLWIVFRSGSSEVEGPTYEVLVEEALCFGWIDSVAKRLDADRRIQWFSPRRKGGIWSALNKQRIEMLTAAGQMTEHGQAAIDAAIADGSWSQYDDVEALVVPEDLERAFDEASRARAAYESSSKSAKKQYLWQVYSAKRDDTRVKRIASLIRELSSSDGQ